MKRLQFLVVISCILTAGSTLRAASIPVANFSFETPAAAEGTYGGGGGGPPGDFFPPWVSGGGNGVQNFPGTFPGSDESGPSGGNMDAPGDGKNAVYVNGVFLYQNVGAVLPNTTYTLTVAAGNQPGYGPGSSGHIALLNGIDQNGASLASTPLPASDGPDPNRLLLNQFRDYVATFSTGPLAVGSLTILLYKDSGQQIDFDNVRLDAVPVPEPASIVLFAFSVVGLVAVACHHRSA